MNREQAKELIKFLNQTPILVNMFYDIDMLPEDLDEKSEDYSRMLRITEAFKEYTESPKTQYQ